jgi:hypothetical protein
MARVQEIVNSGELGRIISISAGLALFKGFIGNEGDIRLDYGLGGGAMMDMGCKSSHVISSFYNYAF